MHLAVKISCALLLFAIIQYSDCYPQFSIPFISWNESKKQPSKLLNVKVPNPLPYLFGKNKELEKTRQNNEVVNQNEKVIIVTPSNYYTNNYDKLRTAVVQTTQNPKNWDVYNETDLKKDQQDKNTITFKENHEQEVKNNKVNRITTDVDMTTTDVDMTTESTTEYESTTFDDSDELTRSGVSGHVVATLLG